MSPIPQITRAHLKKAVEAQNWDLLDRLLEIDSQLINDNSMFTDTWGEWWGMLLQCVMQNKSIGVRVLLKHGADPHLASWGDGIPVTPLEQAAVNPKIRALLESEQPIEYTRACDPVIPNLDANDQRVNQTAQIEEQSGLTFNLDGLFPY